MGKWPGKYVIGVTGNIATGKSVVRKMLEHLGAYGIDADALAHRAMTKGAPGYQPVLDTFGKWVLGPDGQIDRAKLGRLVFTNPEALKSLEEIIHPLVGGAIDILVRRAQQRVIVIEAIKLLEGRLRDYCDAIWVTDARQEVQLSRLMHKRDLSEEEAWSRIRAQNPQELKLQAADVVIDNNDSFDETWKQVASAWQATVPGVAGEALPQLKARPKGKLEVRRSRPKDAQEIAMLITRLSAGRRQMTREDVMAAFGEKAYLFLCRNGQSIGLLGWQVENLVARVDDLFIDASIPLAEAVKVMTTEVERASKELQCEAVLLFLTPDLAQYSEVWKGLGYRAMAVKDLKVRAWQDAAMESMPPGTVMMFKQLRKDRVLRPV